MTEAHLMFFTNLHEYPPRRDELSIRPTESDPMNRGCFKAHKVTFFPNDIGNSFLFL